MRSLISSEPIFESLFDLQVCYDMLILILYRGPSFLKYRAKTGGSLLTQLFLKRLQSQSMSAYNLYLNQPVMQHLLISHYYTSFQVKCRTFIMVLGYFKLAWVRNFLGVFFIANEIEGENVQRKNLQHQIFELLQIKGK